MDSPTTRLGPVSSFSKDPTDFLDPPTEMIVVPSRPPIAGLPDEAGTGPRKDVRRSALGIVLAAGVLPLVSLATGPLLARFLGPEDRGYLSAILAAVNLVPYMLAIGSTDAATYLVARRGQPVGLVAASMASLQALAGMVGFTVLWFLAPVILAGYEEGVTLMRLVSLTVVPALALKAIGGARIGEGRYDLLIAERWVSGLGRLLLLVGFAVVGALTVTSAAWVQVGVLLAGQLAVLIGIRRSSAKMGRQHRWRWRRLRAVARAGYSYGVRSWGGELSGILISRLDQVLMVPLAGAVQLGYYAIAVALAEIPKLLFSDLRSILLSEVATTRDMAAAARACRMSVVALTIPVGVFMLLTPVALPLLFGEDFRPAVIMAEILLLATVPNGVNIFIAGSISALGRPGLQSTSRAIGLVVVVIGLLVLVPTLGGVGAAIVTGIASLCVTAVLLYAFFRVTGIGPHRVLVPTLTDARQVVGVVRRRGRA